MNKVVFNPFTCKLELVKRDVIVPIVEFPGSGTIPEGTTRVRVTGLDAIITLPSTVLTDDLLFIKNISGGYITIVPPIGQTIETCTTSLMKNRSAWNLVYNETTLDWEIW